MDTLRQLLQTLVQKLIGFKKIIAMNGQTVNSIKVYEMAASAKCLGQKLAPDGALGCVQALNAVFKLALGLPINLSASTIDLYASLQDPTRYLKVDSPLPGDIIISPTGMGNNTIAHGHTGIIAEHGILSNHSTTGLFQEQWNLPSWHDYYAGQGGFPVFYFRVL